ncbi:MAG: DUF3656 domain-containing protein [Planctomycetia bacterium]
MSARTDAGVQVSVVADAGAQQATRHPLDEEVLSSQLGRLGGTPASVRADTTGASPGRTCTWRSIGCRRLRAGPVKDRLSRAVSLGSSVFQTACPGRNASSATVPAPKASSTRPAVTDSVTDRPSWNTS